MNIQTLSIVVPTPRCVNNCKFCVSKMHGNDYPLIDKSPFAQRKNMEKRLKYAVIHGIDTIVLTGVGEPLQNIKYLEMLSDVLNLLNNPIPRIEIQTSGILLTDENLTFLKDLGVTTISLSISDLFDDVKNMDVIGTPNKLYFKLDDISKRIYNFGFNIRLSLNMTSYNYTDIDDDKDDSINELTKILDTIFLRCKELYSKQITFRKMYSSGGNAPEDIWVDNNKLSEEYYFYLNEYIKKNGHKLYRLPFGGVVYSVNGISTVIDDDCMNTEYTEDKLKYLILREDMKLYMDWSDTGSLIF